MFGIRNKDDALVIAITMSDTLWEERAPQIHETHSRSEKAVFFPHLDPYDRGAGDPIRGAARLVNGRGSREFPSVAWPSIGSELEETLSARRLQGGSQPFGLAAVWADRSTGADVFGC